jgi:hypothetical protein
MRHVYEIEVWPNPWIREASGTFKKALKRAEALAVKHPSCFVRIFSGSADDPPTRTVWEQKPESA